MAHPSEPLRLAFLLDTPNVWEGRPIAGTPARIAELATALRRRGALVRVVLCDRGMTLAGARAWGLPGMLVHPSAFYGPPSVLAGLLTGFSPDVVVVTDAELAVTSGRLVAGILGARLLYEAHDDEAALSAALAEDQADTARRCRWQQAAVAAADFVTALTDRDASTLAGYGLPRERLLVLPTGCDVTARTCWGPDPTSARLLFIGNLHYAPNAAAARVTVGLVAGLRERGVPVRARITGRGPAALTRPAPGIDWRGPQMDLDGECSQVALAVAPLTAGSGMKMKMLTYLAAGLPVLATSEACVGFADGPPGTVICDDLACWPETAAELLASPGRLTALGRAGREHVTRHHDWGQLAGQALEAFSRWLAMPPRGGDVPVPDGAAEPLWLAEHTAQNALGEAALTSPQAPVAGLPAPSGTIAGVADERR